MPTVLYDFQSLDDAVRWDQRRTAIGLTHKVRRRKERPVAVAVGALVGILGLAAVLGLSSSMYPDRVHSLSAEDLEKLRELHAAQYGTLQERDALLEEGAVDEHAWDTHAALGLVGRARAQPVGRSDDNAATVVLFLAKQSATDITLFVTVDPATHARGVITAARREGETEDAAALRALTASTGLLGPPQVEFVQRLPAALTQTDAAAHAVCAAQHACAFFAAVVRESQLHMRGTSAFARHGEFVALPELEVEARASPTGVSPHTLAGLSVLRSFLEPWVRTAGSGGARACDMAARLAATLIGA